VSSPIIFNNSCSSSHELAVSFIGGGARVYIGTLWNVGNQTAVRAAITFYTKMLADGNVLDAYGEMLRSITTDKYRHIYIMWGLHFSHLPRPVKKSDDRIIRGLLANYFMWVKKFSTTKELEIKRNCVPILRFLQSEIGRRLTPEQLKLKLQDILGEQEEVERATLYEEPELSELSVTEGAGAAS
jgi:CHAT domain